MMGAGVPESETTEQAVGRVMALDLGRRRIGMAVSDPLGFTAQGLPTLERRNRREDLSALRRLVQERDVKRIVVGNPLRLTGRAGAQAQGAAVFAEHLRRELGCEVVMWDERLTTSEAQRVLRASGISIDKRAAAIDRMSAVILLQSYLDYCRLQNEQP